VNRELALLRRMFNLAVEDGRLRTAPHFPMLKEAPPPRGFFEYGEFQRLRQELPEYLRPVATMGYYTGMRRGEILEIRWDSVDLQVGEMRLNAGVTKDDEPHTIPLLARILLRKQRATKRVAGDCTRIGTIRGQSANLGHCPETGPALTN
jgi:integrase